jgi:hypothetical protein
MRAIVALPALLLLVTAAAPARADCASSASYDVTLGTPEPTSVTIAIQQADTSELCGGTVPMLRQDIDTGDVVELAAYCDSQGDFIDECVPAGRYRYGLVSPLPCGGCGGTPYFEAITVGAGSAACTRSAGDAGPLAYTGKVPWKSAVGASATEDVDYVCVNGEGCSAGGSLRVHAFDLLALLGGVAWTIRRRSASCRAG